jgi:glycerol-3-phosphate dehydrogenase subunit B
LKSKKRLITPHFSLFTLHFSMPPQSRYDVVVVGSGLAGLFAGVLAARRGARTLVVARGVGGTHVGTGTVDVWGEEGRKKEEGRRKEHPLELAGERALRAGLAELQALCVSAGYPLIGELGRNHVLPTALGAARPTGLAPQSFLAGDLHRADELTIARLPGFRDFYADLMAANLLAQGHAAHALTLELPPPQPQRDLFATDLAHRFDNPNYRAEVARLWHAALKGVTRLGVPAILGLDHAAAGHRDLSEKLGVELFEIPILPPSVPGMRLFNLLREALLAAGGRMTLGPAVRGWVEADRALGIIAETAGGARRYAAETILLATGGFRHGGLESPAPGQIRESVFDLPVRVESEMFAPLYWEAQPYARRGVRVNEALQPISAEGVALYPNVFAIGGVLAGADRLSEGSREGIDLATAWKVINRLNG